jgi:hypothetical protein
MEEDEVVWQRFGELSGGAAEEFDGVSMSSGAFEFSEEHPQFFEVGEGGIGKLLSGVVGGIGVAELVEDLQPFDLKWCAVVIGGSSDCGIDICESGFGLTGSRLNSRSQGQRGDCVGGVLQEIIQVLEGGCVLIECMIADSACQQCIGICLSDGDESCEISHSFFVSLQLLENSGVKQPGLFVVRFSLQEGASFREGFVESAGVIQP